MYGIQGSKIWKITCQEMYLLTHVLRIVVVITLSQLMEEEERKIAGWDQMTQTSTTRI
jgi:hypothetical protein